MSNIRILKTQTPQHEKLTSRPANHELSGSASLDRYFAITPKSDEERRAEIDKARFERAEQREKKDLADKKNRLARRKEIGKAVAKALIPATAAVGATLGAIEVTPEVADKLGEVINQDTTISYDKRNPNNTDEIMNPSGIELPGTPIEPDNVEGGLGNIQVTGDDGRAYNVTVTTQTK